MFWVVKFTRECGVGVRIDVSILIWSIEIEFSKIEKKESWCNRLSKNRLKIDIASFIRRFLHAHTKFHRAALFYRHIRIFSDTLAIHECSALYARFLFLSSYRLLYTSAPTFSCVLSAEKIVFFPLSMRTIVCCRGYINMLSGNQLYLASCSMYSGQQFSMHSLES